ncbi:MAG: asparagine synthase (glutamine-hydrolyzing), partial [Armatimonadetes bacterium]|nr:asparagine synthase (glutamine-hydrolyzing) [Armatimonadota bacterium]
MCGIAGILNLDGSPVAPEDLESMLAPLGHRGPDDRGIWTEGPAGLGHLRLSIIDLSPAGHQPMERSPFRITYNGEIYNFPELREELRALGAVFTSNTDTEVILKAYEHWGPSSVERLNGMWAFAIWDSERRSLFCSRDRMGVKPFYYLQNRKTFAFASEIKALLRLFPSERKPHIPYLYHFLATGTHDDGTETFFENIRSLSPAHCLTVNGRGTTLKRYWDLHPNRLQGTLPKGDLSGRFRDLLTDAVRIRLRSDVPVGTCLSGGLDSGSIVTLATRITEKPMHTFSAIYREKDCDEGEFIRAVRDDCGSLATEITPLPENFLSLLPKLVWHQDEPGGAPGIYSQWHVMQAASGQVKVLLDGQGGDELLGGYFGYFPPYLRTFFQEEKERNENLLPELHGIAEEIEDLTGETQASLLQELVREFHAPKWLPLWLFRDLKHVRLALPGKKRLRNNGMFHKDLVAAANRSPIRRNLTPRFPRELDESLYRSLTANSIPALLHYEDRNSMAFSIEARTPFLDYRLVEFCMALPYDQKIRGSTTKFIMRDALHGILHPKILNRRDKKGYPTPVAQWFRGPLRDSIREILLSEDFRNRRILSPQYVEDRLRLHEEGTDVSTEIWRWLTLEIWFQE